ncbi:Tetratricopeptide repeat protein [Caballeronia sp. SBC1]|uniref:tetratricopeptide repeat protein n=2 Tax=unclassified Caballeronia TaxID=2646786 RepID=UPI0013E149BD|nr:Tetratricopeptide repeat protein [Caballeronia sp. SBC2]QIN61759.1 Tetratricopeptide repeat protein [Caballeronia sp. SBC1]
MAPMQPLLPPFLIFLRHAVEAKQNGQPETQSIWLQAAAYLHSMDDGSLDRLMIELIQQEHFDEVVALANAIAQINPDSVAANFRLGYALQMANRNREAVQPYRHAMTIKPDFPNLRKNLAIALRISGGDPIEEMELLDQTVEADPQDVDAWINLTMARLGCRDLDGALSAGARAVELDCRDAAAWTNRAQALKEAQRWGEAEHHASVAADLAPNDASLRAGLAVLRLLRGNYAEGWPGHEARWEESSALMSCARPVFPAPRWQGEPLAGKTLLVWGEQGMGDVLQFCRYIPTLAERVHLEGGRIVWNSFPQMGELLVRSLGEHVDEYTAGGGVESLPSFDYEVPLLSLPLVLGTSEATIPNAVPYLRPDAAATAAWRARLAGEKRVKVGLAWTGSLNHGRNPLRRVGWERYATCLRDINGVSFYSLQPGAADDLEAAQSAGLTIADYTAEFATFDDTAAFVSALDLVITVCTSVAHLSGALGQRTWVLLDVNPYWPWMLERRDSPWYPSATLYRQRQFGQWDAVLEDVARDLTALAHHPV